MRDTSALFRVLRVSTVSNLDDDLGMFITGNDRLGVRRSSCESTNRVVKAIKQNNWWRLEMQMQVNRSIVRHFYALFFGLRSCTVFIRMISPRCTALCPSTFVSREYIELVRPNV